MTLLSSYVLVQLTYFSHLKTGYVVIVKCVSLKHHILLLINSCFIWQVLSFTINLVERVRESFSRNPLSSTGPGSDNQTSAPRNVPPSLISSGANPIFKITVVLLDPGIFAVPQRNARKSLLTDGHILQLSMPTGMKERETMFSDQCLPSFERLSCLRFLLLFSHYCDLFCEFILYKE